MGIHVVLARMVEGRGCVSFLLGRTTGASCAGGSLCFLCRAGWRLSWRWSPCLHFVGRGGLVIRLPGFPVLNAGGH